MANEKPFFWKSLCQRDTVRIICILNSTMKLKLTLNFDIKVKQVRKEILMIDSTC